MNLARELEERGLVELAREVCRKHHITVNDLFGPRKFKPFTSARQEMWFRLSEDGMSLHATAALFGKDHTTVLHGVRRFKRASGLEIDESPAGASDEALEGAAEDQATASMNVPDASPLSNEERT